MRIGVTVQAHPDVDAKLSSGMRSDDRTFFLCGVKCALAPSAGAQHVLCERVERAEPGGAAHGELDVPPALRSVGHTPVPPGHPR